MDANLKTLASRFIDFTYGATQLPIIVCDDSGVIVLAVDRKRIGSVHAIAKRVASGELDEGVVTAEDAARDPNMREGCNRVILIDGKRVGTFGIAGKVEVTQPLARIAAAVLAVWAKEARLQSALKVAAEDVLRRFSEVSERASAISAQADATVGSMTTAAAAAAEKVTTSGEIVKRVQEVAQKSRILSINGSVEASRAGDQGRAFSVIAREMIQLTEDARAAANQIDGMLGDVQRSMRDLDGAMQLAAELMRQQTAALGEVRQVVDALQKAVLDVVHASA